MAKKRAEGGLLWVSTLGRTRYETLNPFWAFCETASAGPDRVVLFHDREAEAAAVAAEEGMQAVSKAFFERTPEVERVDFDDENVSRFREKADAVFSLAAGGGDRVIVDLSATTWSFIPVYLTRLAEKQPGVEAVWYLQYAEHGLRRVPYPLIPRLALTRQDLRETGKEAAS